MNESKKEFRGVWIRASLWKRQDLTWFEKCLIAEIDCFAGNCFASNAYLAEMMGTTESRLANALSKLRGMGLIIDGSFNGRVRQIMVSNEVSSDPTAGFTPELKQGSPICEGRLNTSVNIDTTIEQRIEHTPSEFEKFYSAYPRKISKPNAEKAWKKQKCVLAEIMPALQKQMKLWNDPQFIPHPASWLNGRRWEDELPSGNRTTSTQSNVRSVLPSSNIDPSTKKKQWYTLCEERGEKEEFKRWLIESRPEEWSDFLPSMDVRWWVEFCNRPVEF
jgi:hypothetical protein